MSSETLSWSFALRNVYGNYLTAEQFGTSLNASSKSMKKKQIFFLEQDASGKVFLRTAWGKYLTASKDGKFTGDGTYKGQEQAFEIQAQPDGRWGLLSAFGHLAGGDGEKLSAFTNLTGEDRFWIVQLAMHPQVCVRNINRKQYVHLDGDVLNTNETIPWGQDATVTLVFFAEGKYGLQASNGKFLASNGSLKTSADADTKYIIEFFSAQIAFKATNNLYLTALGAKGTLKATKEKIGLDELFVLEDSHPQVKLTAFNNRRVSIRAGQEVSANQDDVTDAECFQLEIDSATKLWSVRGNKNLYWTVGEGGAISASVLGASRTANSWFTIEWLADKIAFVASNGKYVVTKKNGALFATGSSADSESTYVWELINRNVLILRGEQGFINVNSAGVLTCNNTYAQEFNMHIKKGFAEISGPNGKYWQINSDNITVNGSEPTPFVIQLADLSKLLIKVNGAYLQGYGNGNFKATGSSIDQSTLWEY